MGTLHVSVQCRESFMVAWDRVKQEKEELQRRCKGRMAGKARGKEEKGKAVGKAKVKAMANKHSMQQRRRNTGQHGKALETAIGGEIRRITRATTTML